MKFYLSYFALILILCSSPCAQQIETEILQIKMNRVYFPCGEEAGLYNGAPYQIICDEDTVNYGIIEFAGPGMAYSRPQSGLDELVNIERCRALLGTLGIDSSAVITLGTDISLRFFSLEYETLFLRQGDTVIPNLVDSAAMIGNRLDLYIPANIRFSDDRRLDAEAIAWWLKDLTHYGQSYIVRYFFSKLLPPEEGGVEVIDGFTVRLNFYHPLPRAEYFLSHPDFIVYNSRFRGTGPFIDLAGLRSNDTQKAFRPNALYRGDVPLLSRLEIKQYDQSFRMQFAYDEGAIDGYIGLGFEEMLAGEYQTKTLFPEIAVFTSNFGGQLFSQALFPISLYYRFDHNMAHLYFPIGDALPVNRWIEYPTSETGEIKRFYPFDLDKGRRLQQSIGNAGTPAIFCYDNINLRETARYLADIVAREGWQANIVRYRPQTNYDVNVAFFPASDQTMPFALMAATLEMNDLNRRLPEERQLNRPGWADCDRGSRLREVDNRLKFFRAAEEAVHNEGGFFPLFRPYIYAVSNANTKNLRFNFYGYPDLNRIYKLKPVTEPIDREDQP